MWRWTQQYDSIRRADEDELLATVPTEPPPFLSVRSPRRHRMARSMRRSNAKRMDAMPSCDEGLSGPGEDRSEPPERTTMLEGLSWRPMGVYSRVPEGQKTNSVLLPSSCRGSELANHYHLSNLKLLLLHMAARSCFPSAPARSKHTGADYEKAGFALIGT